VDLSTVTGSVAKLFTADMIPLVIGFIVVLLLLTLLRNVIRIATRAAVIVVAVVVAAFFLSGSANAATGTDVMHNVTSQISKGVSGVTGSTVDPTPYMDIQSTYQNIVNKLKEVQAISTAK
jgi:hypothetical protein